MTAVGDPELRHMPIYEFECAACGEHFDRLQKLSDPDPEKCPHCGASGVRRCLTAPSFRLSGSGWYETDFKKEGDKKRNLTAADEAPKKPEEKPAAAKAEKSSNDKPSTDKPAAKAEKTPAAPAPAAKADGGKSGKSASDA
jgi:putative FmdB family regulatory protein